MNCLSASTVSLLAISEPAMTAVEAYIFLDERMTIVSLAEEVSAVELDQKSDLGFDQAKGIVRTKSESVGKHAEETGRRLGIDVATGRRLLQEKSQTPD